MFRNLRWASVGTKSLSLLIVTSLVLMATPQFSQGVDEEPSIKSVPPQPATNNVTAQIESLILEISPDLLRNYVQDLQDFKTRYAYRGDKCFQAAEYIASCFSANGLDASYDDFTYGGYTMRNVIGQKTGITSPDSIYIICAHYDSTTGGTSWVTAPGADDNGSGVAAVMAAAEILSDYEFNCTIRFIAFSGEELGLKGSMNYAGESIGLGENICGVLNLDMIAYNPDPGSAELYLGKDYSDSKAVNAEHVYGPAPANDTTVHMWLDHTNIINCNLYIEEQGYPGVYQKMATPGDYALNLSTGFIDLSGGWGPLAQYENITGWYNYSPAGSLIDYTKDAMLRYSDIFTLTPVDLVSGSSDHAPFSPTYPAMLMIERKYASNPNYHKATDTVDYMNFTYCANVTQLSVAVLAELSGISAQDLSPPAHTPGYPPEGGYSQAVPEISIEVTDPNPVNVTATVMRINGTEVTPQFDPIPLGYNLTFTPPLPYPDGAVINVSVSAADTAGNMFNHSWSFTVDAVAPEPPMNFTISKSRVEAVKRGLVLDIGSIGNPDSRHAYSPSVMFKDGEYKMWYSGYDGTKYYICYATSPDGLVWAKHGAVLNSGSVGEPDYIYAAHPTVIYDGEYRMWYSAYNNLNHRVMYANSSDGINWVKRGIALDIGAAGDLDSKWAYCPSVIKNGEYKMWYSGFDGLKHRILYANSSDGLIWTKYSQDITPQGNGVMYADSYIYSPEVIFHNGTYSMYCGHNSGPYVRTVLSRSQDGLEWHDIGLAIDIGGGTAQDGYRSEQSCIIITDTETKIWYSGSNNANWRILYANITANDTPRDLTLSWTQSPSSDVVGYELYRESRPSAFRESLETAVPEFYAPPAGQTGWTFETATESNISVYSPPNSFTPQRFYMPDDNLLNTNLYIEMANGSWAKLTQDIDYSVDLEWGFVEVYTELLEAGSDLHAFYNHSAGRALRTLGNEMADVRAGVGSEKTYYYVLKAVDRAGNYALAREMPAKMASLLSDTWNLVCSPVLAGQTSVEELLEGLPWTHARTWDPAGWPHQWTSNRPGSELNTLFTADGTAGVWARLSAPGAFVSVGRVSNVTINLTAGWNLVAYPYLEITTVYDALSGLPWDHADVMDSGSPGLIRGVIGSDLLYPGQGIWVHVTSDAVWSAVNVH